MKERKQWVSNEIFLLLFGDIVSNVGVIYIVIIVLFFFRFFFSCVRLIPCWVFVMCWVWYIWCFHSADILIIVMIRVEPSFWFFCFLFVIEPTSISNYNLCIVKHCSALNYVFYYLFRSPSLLSSFPSTFLLFIFTQRFVFHCEFFPKLFSFIVMNLLCRCTGWRRLGYAKWMQRE